MVSPLSKTGVLDLAELSRPLQKIRLDDEISILVNEIDKPSMRVAADAVLEELLKATGTLGSQWKTFPALMPRRPAALGQRL